MPLLNRNENTMLMTIIMSRGLSTDQTTPSTLRRYLSLKSLVTSCFKIKRFFSVSFFAYGETAVVGGDGFSHERCSLGVEAYQTK